MCALLFSTLPLKGQTRSECWREHPARPQRRGERATCAASLRNEVATVFCKVAAVFCSFHCKKGRTVDDRGLDSWTPEKTPARACGARGRDQRLLRATCRAAAPSARVSSSTWHVGRLFIYRVGRARARSHQSSCHMHICAGPHKHMHTCTHSHTHKRQTQANTQSAQSTPDICI